jgi:hypothetical protein
MDHDRSLPWPMADLNEFDIAETSLSSHVIATSRGAPFVGIPVIPRRLFSFDDQLVKDRLGHIANRRRLPSTKSKLR